MLRVRERRQPGEVSQGQDSEVDMEDTIELVGEVVLVDIGDLQGCHILLVGEPLVREGV